MVLNMLEEADLKRYTPALIERVKRSKRCKGCGELYVALDEKGLCYVCWEAREMENDD